VAFGIAETVAGVLILVPRFRRWGAWLAGAMLVAFLIYFGINYNVLRGEECNCFPWIKRVVGPGFFIGDLVMLALAVFAGVWAKPSTSLRSAFVILAAVSVFALVSYGVAATRQTGTRAPDTVTVDGRPYSLQQGKIFIYFFDPECLHCLEAARRMSTYNWGDTKVMVAAIQQPRQSQAFLQDSGLRAGYHRHGAPAQDFPGTGRAVGRGARERRGGQGGHAVRRGTAGGGAQGVRVHTVGGALVSARTRSGCVADVRRRAAPPTPAVGDKIAGLTWRGDYGCRKPECASTPRRSIRVRSTDRAGWSAANYVLRSRLQPATVSSTH
jgi:hypothetical protein